MAATKVEARESSTGGQRITAEVIAELREDLDAAQQWHVVQFEFKPGCEDYPGGHVEGRFRYSWNFHFRTAVIDEFYRRYVETNRQLDDFSDDDQRQIRASHEDLLAIYGRGEEGQVQAIGRLRRTISTDRDTILANIGQGIWGSRVVASIERVQKRIDACKVLLTLVGETTEE